MFGFDAISSYILVVALLTLLIAALVWQERRTPKSVILWFAAGAVGVLLGTAGSFALVQLTGYRLFKPPPQAEAASSDPSVDTIPTPSFGGAGKGAPGKGGGAPGMGAKAPVEQPKRDLTTLVRKLELLTGDIAIELTSEQAASLTECLKDLDAVEKMSDADAKTRVEKIVAVLDAKQNARLKAIDLPRAPLGAGGGAKPAAGAAKGAKPDAEENPFKRQTEAQSLKSLRERTASKGDADKAPPKKP